MEERNHQTNALRNTHGICSSSQLGCQDPISKSTGNITPRTMEESPETGPNLDDGSSETMGTSQTPPSDVPEGRTSMVRWAQFEDQSTIHQISRKKTWPLSDRTSNLPYHISTDTS